MYLKQKLMGAILIFAGLTGAGQASALTLDYLGGSTAGLVNASTSVVQTFTSDTDQYLINYAFLGGTSSRTNYRFSIYDWTGSNFTDSSHAGPALFAEKLAWVNGKNDISGINLALTAGHVYAVELTFSGVASNSVYMIANAYAGGNAFLTSVDAAPGGLKLYYSKFPAYDTSFKAEFAAAPVPEPASYAMLLAGLGLLGITIRRRVTG